MDEHLSLHQCRRNLGVHRHRRSRVATPVLPTLRRMNETAGPHASFVMNQSAQAFQTGTRVEVHFPPASHFQVPLHFPDVRNQYVTCDRTASCASSSHQHSENKWSLAVMAL